MRRDDRGAAALELALVLSLLLGLVALVVPLGALFVERLRLGAAAGDTVRFASSRAGVTRSVPSTPARTVAPGVKVPAADADAEARAVYRGLGALTGVTTTRTADAGCPSGTRTTVVLTSSLDTSPFAGLVALGPAQTLSATATSCQE